MSIYDNVCTKVVQNEIISFHIESKFTFLWVPLANKFNQRNIDVLFIHVVGKKLCADGPVIFLTIYENVSP